MKKIPVSMTVNDDEVDIYVPAHWTLLDVLREELELTGAKEGCGEGVCGSCTVLMDGHPVRSCLTLAAEARGAGVLTVEGLGGPGMELDPLQQAFIEKGAVQCGFCTPGMLMTAKALLDSKPEATEQEVREAISGNICRCTGYAKIVEAILDASHKSET